MLTKNMRFHGHGSLRPVYNKGRASYGRGFKVMVLPVNGGHKAAVVVSKKVHKSAVVRNRIRRRLYTILAEFLTTAPPQQVVVVVNDPQIAQLPADELRADVLQQLARS